MFIRFSPINSLTSYKNIDRFLLLEKLSDLRRQSGAMIPVKQVKKMLQSAITIETHKKY